MTILNEHVISHAYGLPKEKEMIGQSTVSASGFDIDRGTWFVILNGTVQKKDIKQSVQSILGKSKYFSSQGRVYEVTTDSKYGAEVVKTNPSGQVQTVISGGVTSQRVRKNPVSVSEFRSEMTDMLVKDPRRDFKVLDAPTPFGGPSFRDVLYTFVTYRGESYGWTKGGKIYHRRGSLVMPKLKVNRAVEGAKMFYHTHPSKDEPSLSSADDYQFYYDLAFAFGIQHFYTIMENRLDHFEISVKKSKEEDYLKMDEDKVLADINGIIDDSESETTKKHKSSKTMTDEAFYAKMTKDTVTRLNRRFGDFATIKYKGHANPKIVRENPSDAGFLRNPPIRISHIHKASQLEELRDTTNNFEHYGANEYGHSQYVYWWVDHHFSNTNIHPQGRLYKLKDMGLSDDTRRKLRTYMNEEIAPGYSKLDILLLLALYHDVGKKREKEQGIHHSIIASNMFQDEIGPELNLPQEVTDICALLMLTDCGRKNTTPESFRAQAGDYLAVAYTLQIADMLAHHPFMFTSLASEAKEEGRLDHANVEQYKVMVAKELFSKIENFLDNAPRTNPPPTAKSIIYSGSYDTPIDGDIAEATMGEAFKKKYNAQLFLNDAESNTSPNIGLSGGSFRVTMSKAKGHFTEEDPFGADLAVSLYEKYGRILSDFTPGLSFAEVPEPAIMVNPRHAKNLQVVAVAGPTLSGKEVIIEELARMLDGDVIPTVTTRPKRKHEGRSTDRVFISETKFKEMIEKGDFVEWNKSSNGYMYGRRYSDFKKPIAVVDSNLRNVVKYQEAFPNTTSVFLDIDMTPAQLSKKLRSKTAITEKQVKAKADMVLKQIADAQHIPFDKVIKSKGDKPNAVAKEIADDIEKQNPPELLPVYGCPVCDVKAMTHTDWYCKEHGEVKQNMPVYPPRGGREAYIGGREQTGKAMGRFGHKFINTISSKSQAGDREILKAGWTAKVQQKYEPFEADLRNGMSYGKALKKHINTSVYPWKYGEDKPAGWVDNVVTIDEMFETGGVCRHLAILSGMFLEKALEAGIPLPIDKVFYAKGIGHGWLFVRHKAGGIFLIDPAQGRWEPLSWRQPTDWYNYKDTFNQLPENTQYYTDKNGNRHYYNEYLLDFEVKQNPKSREEWFMDWAKLINMKNKELETFLTSSLGKKAGLSASEAKEQGINSGRVSGRAILRMRKKIGLGGPKDYVKGPTHASALFILAQKKWNDLDWEWCSRQVRFNKRFMGDWMGKRKGPLVRKGQPTRRLLALWVWGLDPWRYARKVEKRKTMPKCPKVPWIGMTEKRMYGVQSDEVRMNPPPKSIQLVDLITRPAMKRLVESITRRMEGKMGIPGQPIKGKFTLEEKHKRQKKQYAQFLKDQFGYTGSSPTNALETIFAMQLKKFKKDKLTLYRAIITVNDEVALAETWDKYGVFESWGTNKYNADIYSVADNVVKLMNSGNQALIEGEIYFGDVNWSSTIGRNLIFGKSEDEINPDPDTTIFVKKVSFYKLDDKARKKYADAVTGIGFNWKPWVDPAFKPVNVWEPKEHFPIYGPHHNELYGPAKVNPPLIAINKGWHVTKTEFVPSIMKNGLLMGRKGISPLGYSMSSNNEMANYMHKTLTRAIQFAKRREEKHGPQTIIEVDLRPYSNADLGAESWEYREHPDINERFLEAHSMMITQDIPPSNLSVVPQKVIDDFWRRDEEATMNNPQTGLPGIGDPPVDPATIQPHLDWPQWSPPTWLPKNMIPASAVFSPAVKTTLRGKKVTRPSFYYIQQSDLNHLIQSQQYLELQEAERQKKIREARELKEQLVRDGQKFVDDFRTNPHHHVPNIPQFKFPKYSYIFYNNDTPKRFGDNVLIEKDDRFHVTRRLTDNEGNHLYQLNPDRAFNVKKNIKLGKKYVEENFIMAPDMASSMIPEHLMNPPNIPFPIPEEYQEELERRLSEEMTSEGYRPHTIPEVIEEGLYDDSPSDFSYAQGEYEEFLEEIEKGDLDEAYAEYSDVEGHVAYWLWTNHRIQVPIYTGYHVEKTRERIKIFNHLFNQYGLKFGPEYLKGGSNYEKVHKVRNALDAAANDQRKSRTTDTDEEMAQKVAASVASIVGSRKMETNESANDIQSDFEWMIDNAYEGRLIEMEPGSTYNGRVWWNEQKPWIKEKYGMAPLEGASWLTPIYDENFDPDNEEGEFNEDGTAAPLHFLNQLMRIPLQKEPNAVRILQVALNIGQGLANGSVDHRYEFEDFIAYDNPSDFNQFRKEQREKRAQDKANRQQEREVRQRDRVERLQASEERMRELESQRIARLQAAEERVRELESRTNPLPPPPPPPSKTYRIIPYPGTKYDGELPPLAMYDYPHHIIKEGPYKGTKLFRVSAGYVNEAGQQLLGFATAGTHVGGGMAWKKEYDTVRLIGPAVADNPRKITPSYVRSHPNTLFVFGDNDQRRGKGGQAVIRDEPNAIGFRTKKAPRTSASAYYVDAEYQENISKMKSDLKEISRRSTDYDKVYFIPGIGEGLAKLKERAPRTYAWMKKNKPSNNPMAPGYQSYGWTTQDWRSIKVNNKGDIDYSEKCGAEGTKTPSGSPRLCLPAAVVRSLMRTESGKDVIRNQARKKARAKKGERVPWHPRIKKIWKRIEDKTVKDK